MGSIFQQLTIRTDRDLYRFAVALQSNAACVEFTLTSDITAVTGGERLTLFIHPKAMLKLESCIITATRNYHPDERLMINGYQSWSESREYRIDERLPGLRPLFKPVTRRYHLADYGDEYFYPYPAKPGVLHSHTYTYIRRGTQAEWLGSLSEKEGFTIFEHDTRQKTLTIRKDCARLEIDQSYRLFDLFIGYGAVETIATEYFDSMGIPRPRATAACGWTSWYRYYTGISETIILENLHAFQERQIPLDFFQIDDGYQQAIGDWLLVNDKFPRGMEALAKAIHRAGYRAGLWLAPLICEGTSVLYREHPSWLAQDEHGRPLIAGRNPGWSGRFYAIDLENKEVREYLRKVFDVVLNHWGFDMLKLDFLYAAALGPVDRKTRGQKMHEAMAFLREISGNKLLLGCGVPLGSAFGQVEYCRIGGDIGLTWENFFLKRLLRYRERISTTASLTSTIGRRHLHDKAFLNDPDVFLLRDNNLKLTAGQRHSLFLLNQVFGGLLFTSDSIDEYDAETLRRYLSQFPLCEREIESVTTAGNLYQIRFRIGERHYLAAANLSSHQRCFDLPAGIFFATGRYQPQSQCLDPYQSRCFCEIRTESYCILGSNSHIFPGADVEPLQVSTSGEITLRRSPQAHNAGTIWIQIPADRNGANINGQYFTAENRQGRKVVEWRVPNAECGVQTE